MIKDTFLEETINENTERILKLTNETQPNWGKMNVAQMLAHVNVAYDIAFDRIEEKPSLLLKLLAKLFIKKIVVGETPYKRNARTAPVFLISDERDFNHERNALIENINKTGGLGNRHFEGKLNPTFGIMTSKEWSNMFQKHLDHHLTQFGV